MGKILQCKNLKNASLWMPLGKLKSRSDTTALLEVLPKFSGHLLWRNTSDGCFWTEEIQLPRTRQLWSLTKVSFRNVRNLPSLTKEDARKEYVMIAITNFVLLTFFRINIVWKIPRRPVVRKVSSFNHSYSWK